MPPRHRRWLAVGALATLLVAVASLAAPREAPADPVTRDEGSVRAATPPSPAVTPAPVPGHEVYGYVPYWEMDGEIARHVAGTDLTTLALFSVTHRPDGELDTGQNGFRRIDGRVGRRLVAEARDRGLRVELVYTSFGTERNARFFRDPDAQARWIDELVGFAVERGFDGINVDVEGLPIELVPAYGDFVGALRAALRERDADAQVSVATTSGHVGAAMAATAAANGAHRVFLMGYDYRHPRSEPGASAPLDRLDGERDLVWSLDLYAALGVPVERTILGLPLYGATWPVLGPEFGAQATGRGDAWVPRRNLALLRDGTPEPTYDQVESVEFVAREVDGRWTAVYYDSPRSLRPKLGLADERGLAGAGFWAIGYERGLPGYTDLIKTFRAGELGR